MTGLTVAMLLAGEGHEVVVLERDPAPPPDPAQAWDDWERRSVNQFRLPHLILPPYRRIMERELPAVVDALLEGGALRFNVLGPFADAMDPDGHQVVLTGRRPVIEASVAKAAAATPGVTVRRGVTLTGVVVDGATPPRVLGVVTDAGEEVRGDLVVDAGGRRSPMAGWLTAAGASSPNVEEEDSGLVYYGRHVQLPEGETGNPAVDFWGSIGLLTLPADRGTVGVAVIAASGDAACRPLRDEGAWRAVMALLPGTEAALAAEPVSPLVAMAGIEDRYRRFVVDGVPVATGVVSVGDAWAATNPTLGRGISMAARHAVLLRDVLRTVAADDHEAVTVQFDAATQAHQTPWYESTIWHDRHRLADMKAAASGEAPVDDVLWTRYARFSATAFTNLNLLPHFFATFQLERRPEEVMADPAVVAELESAGEVAGFGTVEARGPGRHRCCLGGEQCLQIGDGLVGVLHEDGPEPGGERSGDVARGVVEEQRPVRIGHTQSVEGETEDGRIGLAYPLGAGVDDEVEQLVDGQERPPAGGGLSDVVGDDGGMDAASTHREDALDHVVVDRDAIVESAELREVEFDAGGLGQLEHFGKVLGQADLAPFHAMPRMVGVGAVVAEHDGEHLVLGQASAGADRRQRGPRRRRDDAVEIEEDGVDAHAAPDRAMAAADVPR